jgi:hypothetical protein
MLHIHPTIKAALALESLMAAHTVSFEITPTEDLYTKAGLSVLKYVVVLKSVQVSGDFVQIVPSCTRAIVDASAASLDLNEDYQEPDAATAPTSCVKCGETLSDDELANYGHLCCFCNSTSKKRRMDE